MLEQKPRIAILSSRERNNFACNSCLYEFEDIISEVDNVDLFNLPSPKLSVKLAQKFIKESAKHIAAFTKLSPLLAPKITLKKDYDLLFIILDFPWSILNVNFLKQWRKKSKILVCYLVELWKTDLDKLINYLTLLRDFDLICLGNSQIVNEVEYLTGKPCVYLAPGTDTLKFCPQSYDSHRCIDVCTMGRRSLITHEALLKLTEKGDFFYHYDPLYSAEQRIPNYKHHRIFNANILKNSRYFIAHRAKIDCWEKTSQQVEIGYRFFEGAAAGTVMLGTPPKNDVFEEYFDWQNAVIPVFFDEPNIARILAKLDSKPELLQKIRSDSVRNSLLKHDWVYRWQKILELTGLNSTEKLLQRKHHLQKLARQFTTI